MPKQFRRTQEATVPRGTEICSAISATLFPCEQSVRTMGIKAARRSELFLNLAMWVVKCGCNNLFQNLNTHLTGNDSAAAGRTHKNQRKTEGKFPPRSAPRAKMNANHGEFVNQFVRFLQPNANARWRFNKKPVNSSEPHAVSVHKYTLPVKGHSGIYFSR
jgi:hypothetical protein